MTQKNKLNLLVGLHSYLPYFSKENDAANGIIDSHLDSLISLVEHINTLESVKTTFHFSGDLIKSLDKKHTEFSPTIGNLIAQNKLELMSGGIYEPLFPLIPREDRQIQLLLMNRLLNHTYGYNPSGAWITEFAWEPGVTFDLAKSRIQYTCLPKEFFTQAGLDNKKINGYYITEEEGRKIAIFPIANELNNFIEKNTPQETLSILLEESIKDSSSSLAIFYNGLVTSDKELSWLKEFFGLLNNNENQIKTQLFNDYLNLFKPNGRIYLSTLLGSTLNGKNKPSKQCLLKYPEVNLLHKKMLRVSKKINSAKEGKSRFKVIKEMINQAHNLLLQGQFCNTYWDSPISGIYLPEARHAAYSKLIKAETLIESASRKNSRWIQISEIDYDCDGNDETLIETDTHNIYISPHSGGTILEYDYKPKNINLTNIVSRKEEAYHPKANLIDHFLSPDVGINEFIKNKLPYLTENVIYPYTVEKIKAKEETCKIAFNTNIKLVNLEDSSEIEFKKAISTRAGDSALNYVYSITNKSAQTINFIFAVEFNLGFHGLNDNNAFFYLNGNPANKTSSPATSAKEEIKDIKQISLFSQQQEIDLTYSWNQTATVYRYPIETLSFCFNKVVPTLQGVTLIPAWNLTLESNIPWELSIIQNTAVRTYDN